jgi:pimeloyl-ACP methyl ester carboxylesterase
MMVKYPKLVIAPSMSDLHLFVALGPNCWMIDLIEARVTECVDQVTEEELEEVTRAFMQPKNMIAQHYWAHNLKWRRIEDRIGPELDAPGRVMIVWGEHDRYYHLSVGEAMAKRMPLARFHVIQDCGHNAHEEKAEEVGRRGESVLRG